MPPKGNEISAGKFLRLLCPSLAVDQRDEQRSLFVARMPQPCLSLSLYTMINALPVMSVADQQSRSLFVSHSVCIIKTAVCLLL